MRQSTPPLPAAGAAATITAATILFLMWPMTIAQYIATVIIFGVVAAWTYQLFNTPQIEDRRILNQKLFDATLGSKTGELILEDIDGDGKITIDDTLQSLREGDKE